MLQKIKQELKQGKTLLQFGLLKGTVELAPLVIAGLFSPELFGSYSLAKMVVFFFVSLLLSSAETPFIVFANQERAKTGKINKAFSVQCIFWISCLCIFSAIVLPLNKYIAAFAKISGTDLFFVLLAFVGLAIKSFLCNLFLALGQRIKNSLAEFAFGGLTILFIFVFYYVGMINLRTVFLVYPISAVLVAIMFIKTIDFNQLLPFGIDKRLATDMFNFTTVVMLGATSSYFINWGDNLVLRLFVPLRDIGQYNLGYQVFKGIVMLIFIVNGYFLPFVSQHIADNAKMKNYLSNKRPKIFLLGLIAIGLLFIFVPYILKVVYKGVYQDSVAVLRVLLVGSVPILYTTFYLPILNALKKYMFSQIANLFQVLLNLVLDLLLVPAMGMLGAAVATAFAYLCHAVAVEVYFRIKLKEALKL
jgi:O-antigen/teichoic acid export membrane protein